MLKQLHYFDASYQDFYPTVTAKCQSLIQLWQDCENSHGSIPRGNLFLLRNLSFIRVYGLSFTLPYYEVRTAHDNITALKTKKTHARVVLTTFNATFFF